MKALFGMNKNFVGHNQTMAKLRVLHEKIDFASLRKETGEIRELDTVLGSVFVISLLDSDEIGIVRCTATEGAELARHQHDSLEILILYEGAMDLILDDQTIQLSAEKKTYYILPGVYHGANFLMDSKSIGITVPAAYR